MPTKAKAQSRSNSEQTGIAIAGIVLLLLFVGWVAYRNFGPAPIPPPPPKNDNEKRMERIYKESGGDVSKLNAEDRQWLHEYSRGREEQAMQYYRMSGKQ